LGFTTDSFRVDGRPVDVFLPQGPGPFPVVVFGHGQALGLEPYRLTFEHLAKKGVAVLFPQYDTGFFDQNWSRMAGDFAAMTEAALQRYPQVLRADQMIYSGHSKGAYIALKAACLGSRLLSPPQSLVLFQPADFSAQDLVSLNKSLPVTLVWGEEDKIIPEQKLLDLFNQLPSRRKQLITAVSYQETNPKQPADHFFVLTKASGFGGRTGVGPLHRYGSWKWLVGAAFDLRDGSQGTNEFVYGTETDSTGLTNLKHKVLKKWEPSL
jgi:predicted esterase